MNVRASLRFLGRLLLLLAGAELAPLLCSLLYGETDAAIGFLASAVITAACGGLMIHFGRTEGQLYRREGILIVVGGWVLASLFGALPYLLTGTLVHPVDALFESASGFTTTGATVLTDIEATGRGMLFWRSFTQYLGGMGIIVLFVALLPELGPGARFLYKLEVPGPTSEALRPRIHTTATILWKIYVGLTIAQTVVLMAVGMNLYDALCHTFSTLSTGGFSPRADSIAAFDSTAIEITIILFMVLAGANFSLYFRFLQRRGWNLFRDTEFRLYIVILTVATAFLSWDLLAFDPSYNHWPQATLDAAFQVVSITTTTGFATADFENWPHFGRSLLIGLMFVGGCAGSTAGSMKVMRMVIGLKSAFREVRLIFSPNTIIPVIVGGKAVPDPVARSVAGFFILYLSCWGLGTVLLSFLHTDMMTAATAAAATLGNVGPGLGEVGPWDNYAHFMGWKKLVMVLLMWLGRLELYSIAALFTRAFWRR